MENNTSLISLERIGCAIRLVRGQKVLLDNDLAQLYGVETRVLNQAVKRNAERFPEDFMFQLSSDEAEAWLRSRSQFVILKRGENLKYRPYAFTEQGAVGRTCALARLRYHSFRLRRQTQSRKAFPSTSEAEGLSGNDDPKPAYCVAEPGFNRCRGPTNHQGMVAHPPRRL